MRILHITPSYSPAVGGAEILTKEISERLVRRGHDVTVLTLSGEDLPHVELINDVRVNRFRPAGRLHDVFNAALRIPGVERLLGFAVGRDTVQMCATSPYGLRPFHVSLRSNPDVVAVINWYGGWLPYQVSVARTIRGFALVGIPLFHTECSWTGAAVHAAVLQRCDAVLAATEHEKRFVEQRSGRNNAYVIGVGIDPSSVEHGAGHQLRARLGIGDAPVVGYVGRMTAYKGVATLIEALQKVWRTQPGVRLLLAGSSGPVSSDRPDELTQMLAKLSAADRSRVVTISRFSDAEKAAIFDSLDVFAMPSMAESFGITYLEAWLQKKAVIGSRLKSTECVITDGVDGVLVAPANADDLAGAILRLLSDRARLEQMGRMGHLKATTHFTWDAIADKVEHIYHHVHAIATKPAALEKPPGPERPVPEEISIATERGAD